MIDTLEAGMRCDFGVRIAKLNSALNAKDEAMKQQAVEKDRTIAEQSQALDTMNLGMKEQEEKIRQMEAEIARLKRDQSAK